MSELLPQSNSAPDSDAGTLRELFRVALPLIISYGSLSMMQVVDRIYLTWLGVNELAAAMPAGMLHWTVMSIPFGIAVYTNTFVSQYAGAGQKDRIAGCVWQGLWLAGLGGIAMILLIPMVRMLIGTMKHAPHVLELERSYYTVLAIGSMPMLTTAVLSAFFNGRGRTIVVMWVNLAAGVFNAVLDPILIFGWGPIEPIGMNGAAIATVLANVLSTVVLAWVAHRDGLREGFHFAAEMRWNHELIVRMLRYGFTNGVQFAVDVGAYMLIIVFMGQIGTKELAATNLAFNLNSLAFIPMIGLGLAVMNLVGQRIGAGQPDLAARSTWMAFKLSGIYMVVFGVLYVAVPDLMLIPYAAYSQSTGDPLELPFDEVRPLVIELLRYVTAYTFFDAMAIIFGNGARGAGDVRFSLWFTIAISWLVMVVPAYLLMRYTDMGVYGTWTAMTTSIVILGFGFMWRFEAGHWRTMRVIEDELIPLTAA